MTSSNSIPKSIIRDIAIVVIGILLVWIGLYITFGMTNPFYVVASGSMIPELEVYDILIVQGNIPFEDLVVGDVIVFDRPSDHNRVIVHRIVSVIDEDPRTLRTKGDANRASIPGTDFPITDKEYIGKVVIVVPDVGYVTQALKPPVNYIIIVVIVGAMVAKHFLKKAKKNDDNKVTFLETAQDEDTASTDDKISKIDAKNDTQQEESSNTAQEVRDTANEHDDSEYVTDETQSTSMPPSAAKNGKEGKEITDQTTKETINKKEPKQDSDNDEQSSSSSQTKPSNGN